MSWDSYRERASGTNVQRILSEMAESQRRKEELRAREQQLKEQQEFERQQARWEAQQRYQQTLMQKPSRQAYEIAKRSGVFDDGQLAEYEESPLEKYQREAIEAAIAAYNDPNDPTRGLGLGGEANARFNFLTGQNPTESGSRSNISTDTYRYKDQLPPERVVAQLMDDKIIPTGDEANDNAFAVRKFETMEKPESDSRINENVAQTVESGARTTKVKKETDALGSEKENPLIRARIDLLVKDLETLRKQKNDLENAAIVTTDSRTINQSAHRQKVANLESAIADRQAKLAKLGVLEAPPPNPFAGAAAGATAGTPATTARPASAPSLRLKPKPPAATGPKKGDTKQAANGMILYFDGNGWTDEPVAR